jgi:hypothetical protein
MSRLEASDLEAIRKQDVREVWFSGCHADVGGGGGNDETSDIALRWMLGEAANEGLGLNPRGRAFLGAPLSTEKPVPSDSHTAGWKRIERLPRLAIDNGGNWPRAYRAPFGPSPRIPLDHPRDQKVLVHESVADLSRIGQREGVTVERVSTSRTVKAR